MRTSRISTCMVIAGALALVSVAVSACGDISIDREPVETRTIEQAVCADEEQLCSDYQWLCPDGISDNVYTGSCESTPPYRVEDCRDGVRGAEIIVTLDQDSIDEGKEPAWLIRHEGEMTSISCVEIEDSDHPEHPNGTWLKMPPMGHCALQLETDEHYYLEFFANIDGHCHGWTECRCY